MVAIVIMKTNKLKKILSKIMFFSFIMIFISNCITILCNTSVVQASWIGDVGETILNGLSAVITSIIRAMILGVGYAIQGILDSLVSAVAGSTAHCKIEDILFAGATNSHIASISLIDIDFFTINTNSTDTFMLFRKAIAKWYYILRLISASILLVVLIYVGIRMALSTVASEEAKYKKMLTDWVTSIALLFVLHYIIYFVILVNKALVGALAGLLTAHENSKTTGQLLIDSLTEGGFARTGFDGIFEAFIFCMIIGISFRYLVYYIKRMITVGFLIIISPLITITYSIDKIGDGKAQALNAWLKELVYNILIQPFHCIVYLVFFDAINSMLTSNASDDSKMTAYLLAFVILLFMNKAEEILKKIFHFESQSMGSMAETAVAIGAAKGTIGNTAAKVGKGAVIAGHGAKAIAKGGAKAFSKAGTKIGNMKDKKEVNKRLKSGFEQAVAKGAFTGTFEEYKKTNAKKVASRVSRDRQQKKQEKIEKRFEKATGKKYSEYMENYKENEMKKDYESRNPGKSFEDVKKAAANGSKDAIAELAKSEENVQPKVDQEKAKINGVYSKNKVIRGYNKLYRAGSKFNNMRAVQVAKNVGMASLQTATAVASSAFALGVSNKAVGAMAGYSIGKSLWEAPKNEMVNQRTQNTNINETSGLVNKLHEVGGTTAADTATVMNTINNNSKAGGYDDMRSVMNDFISQIEKLLGGDKKSAELLMKNVQLAACSDGPMNLDQIVSQVPTNGMNDSEIQELQNTTQAFAQTYLESLVANSVKTTQDVNHMKFEEIVEKVENKVTHTEHRETYKEIHENITRINNEVIEEENS